MSLTTFYFIVTLTILEPKKHQKRHFSYRVTLVTFGRLYSWKCLCALLLRLAMY